MNRFVYFLVLIICFICVSKTDDFQSISALVETNLHDVESRRRKTGHYFLYPFHGWYALSWIYWVKVKLIVVAFFVGTAFIWAIQYISKFYHCPSTDHIHYGHYRSLNDPVVHKFLQKLY